MDLGYLVDRLGPFKGIQGLLLEACPNIAEIVGVEVTDALHPELECSIQFGEAFGVFLVDFEPELTGKELEGSCAHLLKESASTVF